MKLYLNDAPEKPSVPIRTIEADIEATLGNQYYIGFTAACGGSCQETFLRQFYVFNEHAPDIYFNDTGDNIVVPVPGGDAESEIVEDYTPPTPP